MPQYIYKSFEIVYEVQQLNANEYEGRGTLSYKNERASPLLPQQFRTICQTAAGAEKKIKKLMEDYIDFEWDEFIEMHE